ncbi:MAG TPA: tyrosine-type recombinase/integrase [Patescibacteria group bacterium]|nr:tyrosine-type recombinase/integrase [Patescibacteria group bacterium]
MWWAKYRQGGQVVRVSTGCAKKREAQDWIDIRAGKIAEGQPLPVKMDAILYDELRADLDAAYKVKGIRSLVDAERRMKHLDAAFKGWRAVNITESAIDAYVAKRKTEKVPDTDRLVAPATINRELAQLRRMLRLGYRRRKLAHMPTITMLPESQPRQGFVEQAGFDAIASHLAPGPALAATIAFEAAWRIRSEVLTLEWPRVDLAEGSIRLDGAHSKNGQPRTVYLSPTTTKLLVEQRARVEALGRELGRIFTDVFIHTDKGPLQGRRQREFNKAWRGACRKAGYTGTLLHDLRRSGVRAMVRAGVPESVAQRISGHATSAVFRRYDITSDQDLREARDRRAQFGHNQAAKVVSIAR